MRELAREELKGSEEELEQVTEEIRQILIPKDPEDIRNCVIEIRAGTGGDEAALFAGDLLRMYERYCEANGLKTSILEVSKGDFGGVTDVSLEVKSAGAYGTFKFEPGVHRVQRV